MEFKHHQTEVKTFPQQRDLEIFFCLPCLFNLDVTTTILIALQIRDQKVGQILLFLLIS